MTSDVWEIRKATPVANPVLSNRHIKILAHKYLDEYDISVYVDGNIQILEPIKPLINDYLSTTNFALYKHPKRTSLYEEAEVCIEKNKVRESPVREQLERYRQKGFPDEQRLAENRVLFRRHHSSDVKELMSDWWYEFSEGVNRDQLSLMFVLWENNVDYNLIPHSVQYAPQLVIHPHRPEGYLGLIWPYWISKRSDPSTGILKNIGINFEKSISVLNNKGILSLISKSSSFLVETVGTPAKQALQEIGDQLGVIGPDQIYSDDYYAKRTQDPYRNESHKIVDELVDKFQPESVIDFGCAIGTYLERFNEYGVTIHGVEGNPAAFRHAVVPRHYLEQHDLRQPYCPDRYYDLVMSIEVAEHIPGRYSKTFVNTLAKSGRVVILTAAPPGQGGTHHINERPPEYWIQLFNDQGMGYDDETTNELRESININSLCHVPKNMMVFNNTNP
jgi:SAM-dependent methyltransferase